MIEDGYITVEIDEWVNFLRVGWKLNRSLFFNAYAGYYFNGERTDEIENQSAFALAVEYRF